jgi:hypothetical protein
MGSDGYKQAWVRPSTLARAADRRDTCLELAFAHALAV